LIIASYRIGVNSSPARRGYPAGQKRWATRAPLIGKRATGNQEAINREANQQIAGPAKG